MVRLPSAPPSPRNTLTNGSPALSKLALTTQLLNFIRPEEVHLVQLHEFNCPVSSVSHVLSKDPDAKYNHSKTQKHAHCNEVMRAPIAPDALWAVGFCGGGGGGGGGGKSAFSDDVVVKAAGAVEGGGEGSGGPVSPVFQLFVLQTENPITEPAMPE